MFQEVLADLKPKKCGFFCSERAVSTIFPPYIMPKGSNERIKQDHQRWGHSTVERFEKIVTMIKEKNKKLTIF